MSFAKAWALCRFLEGGVSNDSDDPGGLTKMGMTQATWTGLGFAGSVDNATPRQLEDAFQTMWNLVRAPGASLFDQIPEPADAIAFQLYINLPPASFVKALQDALGMMPTGKLDAELIDEAHQVPGVDLARRLLLVQREHYADKSKPEYIEGLELRAQRAEIWLLENS